MKVAIIENERKEVEGAFDYANFKFYNNSIDYSYFESSQTFLKTPNLKDFVVILVDIDLSKKSQSDGYGLIKQLIDQDPDLSKKIIILTGHSRVEEKLAENLLPKFPIIVKPTDFNTIHQQFKKIGVSLSE